MVVATLAGTPLAESPSHELAYRDSLLGPVATAERRAKSASSAQNVHGESFVMREGYE